MSGAAVLISSSGQLGTLVSSARYKHDIEDMRGRSAGLHQLRPVTFRYQGDPERRLQYGLIAEEVAKVYPELVTKGADGMIESVQYYELIPMLLNELQRQQQTLTAQQQELAELRAQNTRLQAVLAQQDEEQRAQHAALAVRLEQLEAAGVRMTVAQHK